MDVLYQAVLVDKAASQRMQGGEQDCQAISSHQWDSASASTHLLLASRLCGCVAGCMHISSMSASMHAGIHAPCMQGTVPGRLVNHTHGRKLALLPLFRRGESPPHHLLPFPTAFCCRPSLTVPWRQSPRTRPAWARRWHRASQLQTR
jgi:hypothetical protein